MVRELYFLMCESEEAVVRIFGFFYFFLFFGQKGESILVTLRMKIVSVMILTTSIIKPICYPWILLLFFFCRKDKKKYFFLIFIIILCLAIGILNATQPTAACDWSASRMLVSDVRTLHWGPLYPAKEIADLLRSPSPDYGRTHQTMTFTGILRPSISSRSKRPQLPFSSYPAHVGRRILTLLRFSRRGLFFFFLCFYSTLSVFTAHNSYFSDYRPIGFSLLSPTLSSILD